MRVVAQHFHDVLGLIGPDGAWIIKRAVPLGGQLGIASHCGGLGAGQSPWRLSVAPMMDWTDRHCRYFHRLITRHTRLYTEMVTTGALLHGDVPRHLDFDAEEHPVALQLGGSEPADLAHCARLAAVGLRRDQPQLRLPQRTRAARRLRRLPDGRAAAGGRLRGPCATRWACR
jgi:hypothetical protein